MAKLQENIKDYRQKNGLTQTDFAKLLHVSKQAVSKWETGRGYPDSAMIPKIAEVMDVSIDSLMGVKEKKSKSKLLIIIGIVIVLVSLIVIPIFYDAAKQRSDFVQLSSHVETTTNITLPNSGSAVIADFSNWVEYGNFVPVDVMSYIVFADNNDTILFEDELSSDERWKKEVSEDLLESLPSNLKGYTTQGEYYILYNVNDATFNELPILSGTYEYMFLVYQEDNHRLLVFDYSLTIEEGE